MKGFLLTCVLVLCHLHTIRGGSNVEKYHDYLKRENPKCEAEGSSSCNRCLAKPGCSWCGDNGGMYVCVALQSCPQRERQHSCTARTSVSDTRETFTGDGQLWDLSDIPVVNISSEIIPGLNSCSERRNCSYCTRSQSCSWCEKKRSCQPFHESSDSSKACGSDLWYRNQCLYSSKIKPCPERTGGCKECINDGVCFWCKATSNCSYYPKDGFVPDNCPTDSWYYDSCSHMKLMVVLAPVLAILLVPILIFIVLGIVLACMRRMGYASDLNDPEEAKEVKPQSPPKEKNPFQMRHKPAPSKIEELKRKYKLDD